MSIVYKNWHNNEVWRKKKSRKLLFKSIWSQLQVKYVVIFCTVHNKCINFLKSI